MELRKLLRSIIAAATVGIFLLAPGCKVFEAKPSRPPNIVFIRTDDQAFWAVGINGNPEIKTPNMDRLHREGAHFTNAFVSTPVCSPSRIGLMTGLYGTQTGITEWLDHRDMEHGIGAQFATWPEVLQKAGYRTGLFGKWHLGLAPKFHPTKHGFDEFAGMLTGSAEPFEPEIEIAGKQQKLKGVWLADYLTENGMDFIRRHKDEPFLMMLDHRSPHTPYAPAQELDKAPYANLDPRIPDAPNLDRELCRKKTLEYYAAVTGVDRNIGRLLDLLDELKLVENTIVVFTSDHGYMIGHHGLWHKGNAVRMDLAARGMKDPAARRPNMFDDSLRVPLAIRWPKRIKPGTVIDAVVLQLDFFPSMLALAEVPVPERAGIPPVQGRDFSPFLFGSKIPWRKDFYGEYDMSQGKNARMRMIRTPDWKLIRHYAEAPPGTGMPAELNELYDLKRDPGETRNLYLKPPNQSVLKGLQRKLLEMQKAAGDPLLASREFKP